MTIRPEVPADYGAVDTVNRLAFGGEAEMKLVRELRGTPGYVPGLSLVAVENGAVTGHIMFSLVELRPKNGAAGIVVLSLAPMSVLPDHQRQGIGSALVRKGLDLATRLGYGAVVVIGHPEYYPRFGFTSAKGFGLEVRWPVPDPAFMALELVPGSVPAGGALVDFPAVFDSAI